MRARSIVGVVLGLGLIAAAGWRIVAYFGDDEAVRVLRLPPAESAGNAPGPPGTGGPSPGTRPVGSYLATLPPPPVPSMSLADWERAYPAFPHAPFEGAGFSAVCLPWRFESTDGAGDPAVGLGVGVLVSYDLDWSPASYGAPRPHHVYRHARADADGAGDDPLKPRAVAGLIRAHRATHAVGGILVRGPQGYVATVRVYGPDGAAAHERAFERPRDLWAVLGDCSAAAIEFLGGDGPPDPALAAHLGRRRADRPEEALAAVGRAARAEPGSAVGQAELDRALAAGPGLAEVRHWRAVERWSAAGDARARADELAAAIEAALLPAALADFRSADADPTTAGRLPDWVHRAEVLAGADHPGIVAARLRQAEAGWSGEPAREPILPPGRFAAAVAVAGRYPNHRGLLRTLVNAQEARDNRWNRPPLAYYDPELSAALAVAGAHARGQAPGGNGPDWATLAKAADAIGRPAHVVAAADGYDRAMADAGTNIGSAYDRRYRDAYLRFMRARGLKQLCRFAEAADLFADLAVGVEWAGMRADAAGEAVGCAALAGRPDLIDRLAADPRAMAAPGVAVLVAAAREYLAGRPVAAWHGENRYAGEMRLLRADQEAAEVAQPARDPSRAGSWIGLAERQDLPRERLDWLLLDQYVAADPTSRHAAGFYEAWLDLHPDDPRAAAGAARRRQAVPVEPPLPSVDQAIEEMLPGRQRRFGQQMPAWAPVARMRQELEAGRPAEAARLAAACREHRFAPYLYWFQRDVHLAAALARVDRAVAAAATRPVAAPLP